jgi:hypothetical protein
MLFNNKHFTKTFKNIHLQLKVIPELGVLLQKLFRMSICGLNTYLEGGILLEWQQTNSMELSPFSDSTSCSAAQEFSNITSIWNSKVHYLLHESPPLVPV